MKYSTLISNLSNYCADRSRYDNYALPGYFLMTGRRGLEFVDHDEGTFPICQHPNIEDRLLVFPSTGTGESLNAFLYDLDPWPENGVQLARIPPGAEDSIIASLDNAWRVTPVEETALDWGRYPIRSLPVKEMALREGKSFQNHRRKYNRAAKDVEKVEVVDEVNSEHDENIGGFIYSWAQKKYVKEQKFTFDDYVSPYFNILTLHSDEGISTRCIVFKKETGKIMGIVVIEIFNRIAAAYMNIAKDDVPYFPAYILMNACEFLHKEDLADVLCLGGSEMESLDKFKCDLQPDFARTDSNLSYFLNSFVIDSVGSAKAKQWINLN